MTRFTIQVPVLVVYGDSGYPSVHGDLNVEVHVEAVYESEAVNLLQAALQAMIDRGTE